MPTALANSAPKSKALPQGIWRTCLDRPDSLQNPEFCSISKTSPRFADFSLYCIDPVRFIYVARVVLLASVVERQFCDFRHIRLLRCRVRSLFDRCHGVMFNGMYYQLSALPHHVMPQQVPVQRFGIKPGM